MSPLELRKRLLIAESEINRLRLLRDGQALTGELGRLASRVRSFAGIASWIIALGTGLAVCRSRRREPASPGSSWLRKAVSGARLASTIWLLFRSIASDSAER